MVETAGILIQAEKENPEQDQQQDQHISEQGPTSTEGDAPGKAKVYWGKNEVWQYLGGCFSRIFSCRNSSR